MNENIEKRKTQLLETLQYEYNEKPRSWWQTKDLVYKSTATVANENNRWQQSSDDIEIKFKLKEALIMSALFFGFIFFIFYQNQGKPDYAELNFYWMVLMAILAFCYSLYNGLGNRNRMKISRDGLYLGRYDLFIPWQVMVATYIKEDHSGESTSYYLVIHYYNNDDDTFKTVEMSLESLTMKSEDIASEIEYRKEKAGK